MKDDAVKVLHSICQHIWKVQQYHRTGKVQFSFQSQRKAMPKNAQTTTQLHSSQFSSLSHVRLFATPCTAAHQACLSITNSWSLPKLMFIELVMPPNHLILCQLLLLLPSAFPASGSFQMSQFLGIRWPKYWSSSFNISPSNEQSGLISFKMDWLDLLAVQGKLKSLLQYHCSKASILELGLVQSQKWMLCFIKIKFVDHQISCKHVMMS